MGADFVGNLNRNKYNYIFNLIYMRSVEILLFGNEFKNNEKKNVLKIFCSVSENIES